MTTATLKREYSQENDIPTRLNRLAAHLAQIQSLANNSAIVARK